MSEKKMTTEHTPGPWSLSQQNGLCLFIVANDEAIAECFRVEQSGGFDATLFANAHLISAAPDMLEALRKLLPSMKNWLADVQADAPDGWQSLADDISFAEAAIKKATEATR